MAREVVCDMTSKLDHSRLDEETNISNFPRRIASTSHDDGPRAIASCTHNQGINRQLRYRSNLDPIDVGTARTSAQELFIASTMPAKVVDLLSQQGAKLANASSLGEMGPSAVGNQGSGREGRSAIVATCVVRHCRNTKEEEENLRE